ncbi:ABC transporter permease [Paenisporosarcina indica]|uniref:ABC transporter permease n=1 Tax=Paenisporosarcina indica TaxID=650093 RepID=UPI00094FA7B3|nr:ABC transporter permease [Paenisporosarcina indica]
MNINVLIFRNLKKNFKNYYLYVFALFFSVALYFSFVTLQYDPALDETKGSVKGGASIRAASILLVAIVTIFVLYANTIFIKRRSREIGLFQLIGMTKTKIFRILSIENFILYFSSVVVGIIIGFSFSKLILMILFKVTAVDTQATLQFSSNALIQTLVVFGGIYLFILLMNYLFIRKQSILSLFNLISSTESNVKKTSKLEIIIGIAGLFLIASGYFVSSQLFDGDFTGMTGLFIAMGYTLASVIIGTYLFYKGSVSFIANMIRKKKDGHLAVHEVLSLSSIQFRLKSNALLLTIITSVSALAIGLLSLSYISYYSADKVARDYVPEDFALTDTATAKQFKQDLETADIDYTETLIDVIQVDINASEIIESDLPAIVEDANSMTLPVVSDKSVKDIDVSSEETLFTGTSNILERIITIKDSGTIELLGKTERIPQNFIGVEKEFVVSSYFTNGGVPIVIVDEPVFDRLKNDMDPDIQKKSILYIGIDIVDEEKLEQANELFAKIQQLLISEPFYSESRLDISNNQKNIMGLVMFIVGFLGLAFLITSGCILYFKQMGESDEEKPSYTILRKLGFTQGDLLKGIQLKQLFNFGIPLIVGLCHSYFAVQSGWFLFGTQLWTPMFIVMGIYTVLYSIFGLLSVLYSKKVIKEAL